MTENKPEKGSEKIFSLKQIIIYSLIFVLVILSIHFIGHTVAAFIRFGDLIFMWPIWASWINIPSLMMLIVSGAIGISFLIIIRLNLIKKLNIHILILVGLSLIIGTSLIRGWALGIDDIFTRSDISLYFDALKIENPIYFIVNYEEIQKTLNAHSRTHPPGAALSIYILYLVFREPGFIALGLCIFSTIFSGYFLYGILKRNFDKLLSKNITFLYLLLPSVQISYLANVYAIVTTFMLAFLYFYFHPNLKVSILGSIISLFLFSFISFMVIFIVAVIFLYAIFSSVKLNIYKIVITFLSIFLIYLIFLICLNFNYMNTFLYSCWEENQEGFKLISQTKFYIFYRISGFLEFIIYLGPFLTIIIIRLFKELKIDDIKKPKWLIIFLISIVVISAMLLAGTYKTGETARGALFLFPILILPVAIYIEMKHIPQKQINKLFLLVFGQTLLMQLFIYFGH